MPIIKITKADIAKTKNLDPGWYQAKVVRVGHPAKSKDGGSVNIVVEFLIDHPSGKEIPVTFNSKLFGKFNDPFRAIFGKDMDEGEFDPDCFLGKTLDVKVSPVEYNGNMIDNIIAYLPFKKSLEAAPF